MAQLTVQDLTGDAGGGSRTLSFAAVAAAGDTFPNDGRTMVHVANGGTASVTVTFNGGLDGNGRDEDLAVAIAAGSDAVFGFFRKDLWNNGSGQVEMTYSGTASVTAAVYRPYLLPR